MGASDPVLRVSSGDPEGDLHYERDRIDPVAAAPRDTPAWRISDARVGQEGLVPCNRQDFKALEPSDQRLGRRTQPLLDRV